MSVKGKGESADKKDVSLSEDKEFDESINNDSAVASTEADDTVNSAAGDETANADESEAEKAAKAAEELRKKDDETKPVVYIAIFVFGMVLLGVFDLTFQLGPNQCQMTYMYEWPEYVNISMGPEVESAYPMYGLYVYGEGSFLEELRENVFTGIPVLYIPGNGGSYKQVRSLASVALRKAVEDSEYETHFDYFTVDFNEEQSAIYGGVLRQQAAFTRAAVHKILSLYPKDKNHPKSVVLISHSMGGIVAKSLFVDPSFKATNVEVMMNLATPSYPVMVVDAETYDFYSDVNTYWELHRPEHVNLVSLGGGSRDLQVRGGLTQDKYADICLSTTESSSVWVSADHRCIVWCKQLVLSINRALADMIVKKPAKQISADRELRGNVLNYHLVQRSGGKSYRNGKLHTKPVKFNVSNTEWKTFDYSSVPGRNNKIIKTKDNFNTENYVIPITSSSLSNIAIDAVEMEADNWLYGCTAVQESTEGITSCTELVNLSGKTKIIPSRGKRKLFQENLRQLKREEKISHLVVSLTDEVADAIVHVDMYSIKQRSLNTTVPSWTMFFKWQTVLEETKQGIIFYNISLVGMTQTYQTFNVWAEPLQCKQKPQIKKTSSPDKDEAESLYQQHYGLAKFITPWAADSTQTLLAAGDVNFTNVLTVKLMAAKNPEDERVPQVHLYLDPDCTYTVKLRPSVPGLMGQILRYYAPLLPCFLSTAIILTVSQQMLRVAKYPKDDYVSVFFAILTAVTPISVVLPSKMMAYVSAQPMIASYVPRTDYIYLQDNGLDFSILPIMLMFLSIGGVFILAGIVYGAVIGGGYSVHKALVAFTARRTPTEAIAEYTISSVLTKFPVILTVLALSVTVSSCGALSMFIMLFAYFVRLFLLYEEYLETKIKNITGLDNTEQASLSSINYHIGIILLYLASALFSLPTLITWTQRYDLMSPALPADPTMLHAIILALALPGIWLDGDPVVLPVNYKRLSIILQFFAIVTVAYGQISLYRVPYMLSASVCTIAINNIIAKFQQ